MEGQNNFNKNINQNPFPQIQGNAQFNQPNPPIYNPQGINNPFQNKNEQEKKKLETAQKYTQHTIKRYSTASVFSNVGQQGIFKNKNKIFRIYDKNSFIGNAQNFYGLNTNQKQIAQNNNNKLLNPFTRQNTQNQLPNDQDNNIYDEDYLRGRPCYNYYEIGKIRFKMPQRSPPPKKVAPIKLIKLENKIIKEIIQPSKNPTYDKFQEYVVEYGYKTEKTIEKEIKQNPENFIEVKEAIQKKNTNEKLFILGKLGESLQNMGIKVVIDKRENLKDNNYIINNQFISSGLIKKNKYVIHIQENDINKINQILNNINQRQIFIENWKQNLSNYLSVPKEDIYITNLRGGSITMDTIFKREVLKDINGNNVNIDEKLKNFANSNPQIISIFKKNILGACKLSLDMLDEKGNRDPNNWAKPGEKRGGIEYFPPDNNWVGYGLRVLGLYDNNNDDWIAMNGNPREWAVAYHGTSESAVKPICIQSGKFYSTVKEGALGQKCKECNNINPTSKINYPKCGEGTYCSPDLSYANRYGGVIIMCRVDPKLIRIPEGKYQDKEWITDGTRNTIRPYRILYKLNT